jgi:hypothetical protein
LENANLQETNKQEREERILALQFHHNLPMISSKLPIL